MNDRSAQMAFVGAGSVGLGMAIVRFAGKAVDFAGGRTSEGLLELLPWKQNKPRRKLAPHDTTPPVLPAKPTTDPRVEVF